MSDHYKILWEGGQGELVEKKSRFIATTEPVETEEEALAFIERTRKKYWDARHNCFAYCIGDKNQLQRCSDDGEPSQTAGRPMLDVLLGAEVHNICVVVTRYFGGILLGAGGLTRAYGKAARDALSAAGVSAMGLWEQVQLECDYGLLERVKLEIAAVDGILDDVVYAARVTVTASLPGDGPQRLQQRLTELSAGSVTLQSLGQGLRPGPREEI